MVYNFSYHYDWVPKIKQQIEISAAFYILG